MGIYVHSLRTEFTCSTESGKGGKHMSLADYDELPLMAINSQRVTQIALD